MTTSELQVIVLCAGGHAKVVIDVLALMKIKVLGIVDTDPALTGKNVLGVSVLGGENILDRYEPARIKLANGLGGAQSMASRRELFERFLIKGFRFVEIVHPSAVIAQDVVLSEGAQVMAGAVLQTGVSIGEDTIINTRASVDHDCSIGRHVHVAPGVTICGGVEIDDEAYIGSGSTVTPGVRIGKGVLVKAGSLITRDLNIERS